MIYKSTIENILSHANGGETLLGGAGDCLSDEERTAKENAYLKARIIVWTIWFDGYAQGNIDLRELLEHANRSLVAIGIDDFLRWKTLGLLSENALSIEQPKRKRGNAGYVDPRKSIAIQLVELAKDDGFVLARESKNGKSAFDHVAEILTSLGMDTNSRQVHDWCYPRIRKIPQ